MLEKIEQFGGNLFKTLEEPHSHKSPRRPDSQETPITSELLGQDTGPHWSPEKNSSPLQ